MKKHIDLFSQLDRKEHLVRTVIRLRKIGLIILVLTSVVLLLEWATFFFFQSRLTSIEKKRTRLSNYILQNKEFDVKIQTFMFKYTALRDYLTKDSKVNAYYDLLKSNLETLGATETLASFSLTKDHEVTFVLRFSSFEKAIQFLAAMEESAFPDYFETLDLGGLAVSRNFSEGYTLNLNGKFKPIKDAE